MPEALSKITGPLVVPWSIDPESSNGVQRLRHSTDNFLANGAFEVWNAGTTAAPDAWTLAGDVTIARSTDFTIPPYSAALAFGAANSGEFYQSIGVANVVDYTFSCYAKRTSGTGQARLVAQNADSPYQEYASVYLSTVAGFHPAMLTVMPTGTNMRFAVKSGDAVASTWIVDECMYQESLGIATTFSYKPVDDTTSQNIYGNKHFGYTSHAQIDTTALNVNGVAYGAGNDFINLTSAPYGVSVNATRAANTAALLQAFTDAAASPIIGGKKLYLPGNAAAYLFNHVQPTRPGVLVGDGMGSTRFDVAGTSALTLSAFQIFSAGSDANKKAITVQANKAAVTVTVSTTDAATFTAGDRALVRATATGAGSTAFWPGSEGQNGAKRGEFVRIKSVNTGTGVLTLYAPLEDTYTLVMTPYITKTVFWKNAGAHGVTFENSAPLTGVAPLLTFRGVENLHGAWVELLRGDHYGMTLDACIEFAVTCYPRDLADQNTNQRYGYGAITFNGCQDGEVTVHATRCRHAVSTGADWMGIPRHITFRGFARECTGAAWDTHCEGEDLLFEGCHAANADQAGSSNSATYGFQIRSPSTRIQGGIVSQCQGKGLRANLNLAGFENAGDLVVDGLVISDITAHTTLDNDGSGMYLGSSCRVRNCQISNPASNVAIRIAGTTTKVVVQSCYFEKGTLNGTGSPLNAESGIGTSNVALVKNNVARGWTASSGVTSISTGTTTGFTFEDNRVLAA